MKLRFERAAAKISSSELAVLSLNPITLGGYTLKPGGFVQVYSAILAYVPNGVPYAPAPGSQFTIRYGSITGPLVVEPLPAEGLIDQAETAAGIFQPISTLVKSAPLVFCLEGGVPTAVGNGSLQLVLMVHDPVMRVLDDDF